MAAQAAAGQMVRGGGGWGGGGGGGSQSSFVTAASVESIWRDEVQAASAVAASSTTSLGKDGVLLGRVWEVIGPACRRQACNELKRILSIESSVREQQQRSIMALSSHALLSGPLPSELLPSPTPHPDLDGLYLFENFVSKEEEAALIEWVDHATWVPSSSAATPQHMHQQRGERGTNEFQHSYWNSPGQGNEGKNWGLNARTHDGRLASAPRCEPLPAPIIAIAERMVSLAPDLLEGGAWRPNQANAISYTKAKGHYLGGHCDDRQLSGLILCNLSLGCDAYMRYKHDRKPSEQPHRVLLPKRSLQLQTGHVRFNYRHGISSEDLLGARRVSITLRKETRGVQGVNVG